MELTDRMKKKISDGVWQKYYPAHERHILLKALESFGAPQKELADALGISKQAMSIYLAGKKALPRRHIRVLGFMLMVCVESARQVLVVMKRNASEELLGPNSRKATATEMKELEQVIADTEVLMERYHPLTISFPE